MEQRPPSTAASSTTASSTSSAKSWPLPVNIARRHRAPTNPFDTDPFEMGSLSTSTSRAELYSPHSTPPPTASSQRSTQSSLRSTARQLATSHVAPRAPATARLNGVEHQLFLFANLDQLSMAVLRQRAMRLRDVLEKPAKERNLAMPFGAHGAPLPADRRILQAFILDAQLVLVRLAGHDAKKEWSVSSAFGAPADLTTVTSASLLEKNQWAERNQHDVLTPLGMGWQEAVAEGRISEAPLASPRMASYHQHHAGSGGGAAAAGGARGGARSGSSCQASSSSLRGSASAVSLASSAAYSSRPSTAPAPPANHEGGGASSDECAHGGASPGERASPRYRQAEALPDVSLPVMR